MDDKQKSFWKKSWRGPRTVFLRLTLFSALVWLITFFVMFALSWFETPGTKISFVFFVIAGGLTIISGLLFLFYPIIRWLCHWRNFKKFIFGIACVATLIALFYVEENWRGKHDWEKYKRAEEAKGEKLDFKDFVPPPVPDDQNFAFSPVWIAEIRYGFWETGKSTNWYGDQIYSPAVSNIISEIPISISGITGTNFWGLNLLPHMPEKSGNWQTAQFVDLKPWQNYYRDLEKTNPAAEIPIAPQPQTPARDVLLALSKFDPVIDELKKDSARPYAYFPIQYDTEPPFDILLPHLAAVKQVALVLQLRAIAELQNNQTDIALDDIKLSLRLTDSIRCEPFIISHLVRIAILQIALQPIYEGLAEHKWSDAQLVELDSELSKLDFLADYESSVRGERTMAVSAIDYMRRTRKIETPDFSTRGAKVQIARFIPSAFFYQNELTIAQMHQRWTIPLVNDEMQTVSPSAVMQDGSAATNQLNHFHFYGIFARMIFPAIATAVKKYTYAQTSANLARVAIALERYRLAHGNFPDSLNALAPQFLEKMPHDIIGGAPLHYRKTADGQFVLYSIGWNETDDGGVAVFKNGSSKELDLDQGDWVWKYPQK